MTTDWIVQALQGMGFSWPGEHYDQWMDGTLTGWPIVRYQAAYSGAGRDDWLTVDGIAGPKTRSALVEDGQYLSEHFRAAEFTCRHCGRNGVRRELVAALEILRVRTARPLHIVSGWRCTEHNKLVGGATNSMHLEGLAADITPAPPQRLVRGLRQFSGLGFNARGATVRHVDVRHVLKGQQATIAAPATWRY